jgi:hypothetical protein
LASALTRTLFLGLSLLLWACASTANESAAQESRYHRPIAALPTSAEEHRARFASIALLELAEVYIAESDLARKESEQAEDPGKLLAWSRAVERYASQLSLVLDDIALGFPVELRLNDREVSSVNVGGRVIMLAHPRADQQFVYEHSVLTQFCSTKTCEELTENEDVLEPIPMSPALVKPRWEFDTAGPNCSYRSVRLSFTVGGDLTRQRQLCQQLMQELEILSTELAWQQRHGVDIQWQNIKIEATPMQPEHLVLLNVQGDSLLVSLPLLYGTPGLLKAVLPYLQQRYAGDNVELITELKAADLGWN